eukprot:120414-Chlamydomonas_euryale.AAC.2
MRRIGTEHGGVGRMAEPVWRCGSVDAERSGSGAAKKAPGGASLVVRGVGVLWAFTSGFTQRTDWLCAW